METTEQIRDKVREWFSKGTDRRNGESKVNAFCTKMGIARMTYYRKMDEMDYDFLMAAVEFIESEKHRKKSVRSEKEALFVQKASLALAI